ncbi:MAG TPA: RsmG family class I SAM-dependent methyltransferase [Candidatus Binataceae bacterium]|nr:RsmG family class I SAM-dependent methyltransferase [Candidatus Binataceae bacterium]
MRLIVGDACAKSGYSTGYQFLRRIEIFAATLALWGERLNLTSAPDDAHEIAFHIIDSLAPLICAGSSAGASLAGAFDRGVRVLDLGSGAGFPALILASDSDADFVLLEARRKRASFLAVAAAEMGLANHVRVDASRTDSTSLDAAYDVVTARAFAEPGVVYRTAAARLRAGGRLILYINPSQRAAMKSAGGEHFAAPSFIPYEVARGALSVSHVLAISRRL